MRRPYSPVELFCRMKLILLTSLLGIVGSPIVAFSQKPIELAIRSEMDAKSNVAMHVELTFPGEAGGETVVRLPSEWGGQAQLYLALRDLDSDQAEILSGTGPSTRRLNHAPSAWITLRYQVVVDENGPQFNGRGNDYRVHFRDRFLFALGETWMVQPESVSDQSDVKVAISFPEGIPWASDLQHHLSGKRMLFEDLMESVLVAGDIRIVDAGSGVRLAIRGEIDSRNDAGWRDTFQKIAQAQRDYWNANVEPFLVTIVITPPVVRGSIFLGGTGRTDAFAFFSTNNADPPRLDQVMAHEMMHTWVPRRIGGMPLHEEQADYWLSEGFTDWVSWRVLVRSGFWTPHDFVKAFNENLKDYDLSPVREVPNAQIVSEFWRDRATSDLPYRRGMLLATWWDYKVRQATNGKRDFDDVVLHMQQLATLSEKKTTAAYLLAEAMHEMAGIDITSDLNEYVMQGRSIELPVDLFTEDCSLTWIERPTFHRGFDIEATLANEKVISGVVEDGPAWRAGLRNGMSIVKLVGGEIGNSQVEIAYELKDGDQPLTLRWRPTGSTTERFRMLKIRDDLSPDELATLAARMGGSLPN